MIKYSLLLSIFLLSCGKNFKDSEKSIKFQETAYAMETIFVNIPHNMSHFERLGDSTPKPKNAFDPNIYFSVLKNIKMTEGYKLDYVVYYDSNGSPTLFACKEYGKNFRTLKEYTEELQKVLKIKEPYLANDRFPHPYRYENYIELKDTDESYYEYVLFKIMNERFYRFWHSNYNDAIVVATKERFYNLIDDLEYAPEKIKDFELIEDIEPRIKKYENKIEVTLCVFSKWGGLMRRKYTFNKFQPHYFINKYYFYDYDHENVDTLMHYKCNIVF